MLKLTEIKTKTYEYENGFFVDIVDDGAAIAAYLWHEEYGVKELMFGQDNTQGDEASFMSIVAANLPEYIGFYADDYMN